MLTRLFHRKLNVVCLFTLLLMLAFYDVVFLNKTFKVTTANSQALPSGAYGQENNKPRFIPVNGTDTPVMEEPVYEFVKQNLRRGILPLWNPHQACGYPLIGMIETAIFFPLSFILYIFPELFAWDLLILSRFLLAGLFTFWLMKTLRFSNIPALVSGIVFMLSGPMVLFQYWTVNVDLLAPVILIAIERMIRHAGKRQLAFLSLAVFFSILGGHPEHIFLVNFYGLCFFVFRLWSFRQSVPVKGRPFGAPPARGMEPRAGTASDTPGMPGASSAVKKIILNYLCAYALAGTMAAFILFPFFRNLATEFWHAHPPNVGVMVEEQREKALTLALPHFFQRAPITYQWVFAGWWGGYLGTIPLALAFLSLFQNQRRRLNAFFAVMAFLIIGKEYGLPIINWVGYLPVFNVCRYASHTVQLAALTVAILAGMGTRALMAQKNLFWQALIFSACLILVAVIHLDVLKNSEFSLTGIRATFFALWVLALFQFILFLRAHGFLKPKAAGLLVAVLVFSELFLYIHRERPRRFESFGQIPYMNALKSSNQRVRQYGIFWAFYPNTATGFGIDDLGYFFGLVPHRFVDFVNTLFIPNHFRNDLRPPALRAIPVQGREHLLNLLNVKYLIGPSTDVYARRFPHFEDLGKKFKTVYDREVKIYERPEAFPRTFVVHRVLFEEDKTKTLGWVGRLGPQLRLLAVVNSPENPTIKKILKETPLMDASASRILEYTPNQVLVEARMDSPGFLVMSDAYHPDWKVTVNGRPWKLFQTDHLIRSVFLPKGHFQIKFVFAPMSFYAGAVVSLFGFLVLFLLIFGQRILHRNPHA